MSKFELSWGKAKTLAVGLLASGKKNAPTLMTAGSVVLGWVAVYIFWKQSRKAEKKIEAEEEKLNAESDADIPLEQIQELPVKEKAIVYLQYCWMAGVMGLISSALAIGANSINLSRLAEMALLTQFMGDRSEKQKELIEKLRGEVDKKKLKKIDDEELEKQFPKSEILEEITKPGHEGQTLFIDKLGRAQWWSTVENVTNGIDETNNLLLRKRMKKVIDSEKKSPFYAKDEMELRRESALDTYSLDDDYSDAYSAVEPEELLKRIGAIHDKNDIRLGEILEFRCYTNTHPPLKKSDIMKFKEYIDHETGIPAVCFIDYADYLYPSSELTERAML